MQITSDTDVLNFQKELDKVFMWAQSNKMTFNSKKFEHLRYNPNKGMNNLFYGGYITSDRQFTN